MAHDHTLAHSIESLASKQINKQTEIEHLSSVEYIKFT